MCNKTKRQLAIEQIELQYQIQKAGFNIVECGTCGTILLHKTVPLSADAGHDVHCFGCMEIMDLSDCPDYWYEGAELRAEFDEES